MDPLIEFLGKLFAKTPLLQHLTHLRVTSKRGNINKIKLTGKNCLL